MDYAAAVKRIIEADNLARRQAAEAKERVRRQLGEQLEADKENLKKEYEQRMAKRLEKIRAVEEAAALEERRQLEESHRQSMAKLESYYAQNREAWVQRLFEYVTGDVALPDNTENA